MSTEIDNIKVYFLSQVQQLKEVKGNLTYKKLADWCGRNNITMYKPRGIQEEVVTIAGDIYTPEILLRLGVDNQEELRLPVGDNVFIPKFSPTHTTVDPLITSISAYSYHLANLMANQNEDPGEWLDLGQDLIEVINTTRFCSGTLEGQMNRFKQGTQVKNGTAGNHKNKTFRELGLTIQGVSEMLNETLPLSNKTMGYTLDQRLIGYIYSDEEAEVLKVDSDIPPISGSRTAGLPFLTKKKQDVALEAMTLADSFLLMVSDLIGGDSRELKPRSLAGKAFKDPEKAADKFLKDIAKELTGTYWYMRAGLMFPKAERYVYNDIDTKTRNIWAASYVTHLLANQISYGPAEHALNALNCSMDTPSLAKFSATQGGMNQFVELLLHVDTVSAWIYADNIYMYFPGPDRWYSLDLTKGEANATREMAAAVATYLLREGWSDDDHNPLFSQTWAFIAMFIIPACVVDSISVIGNLQLANPGQGSGNPWTFLINHAASTLLLHFWRKKGQPEPSDAAAMEALMAETGIDFKIELVTNDVVKQLRELKVNSIPVTDNIKNRKFVSLDLLGWDVTHTEFGYTPVLAKDRLLKSFICPQPPGGTFRGKYLQVIHKYIQMFGLLSCGAWAYPVLSRVVEEYMMNYWTIITASSPLEDGNMDEELLELVKKAASDSAYAETLSALLSPVPMHLMDWRSILYEPKSIKVEDPKPHAQRSYIDVKRREGEKDDQYHKRFAAEVSRKNKDLSYVDDPSRVALNNLVRKLAPGDYAKEYKFASANINDSYLDLMALDKSVMEKVEKRFGSQLANEFWIVLFTGELQAGTVEVMAGIPNQEVTRMRHIPPLSGMPAAQDPRVYKMVTGTDRVASGPLTPGEKSTYGTTLQRRARGYLQAMMEDEVTQIVTGMYLVHTEVLLSQMMRVQTMEIVDKPVGSTEEARNPTASYGLPGRPSRANLESARLGLFKSRAAARREKRAKATARKAQESAKLAVAPKRRGPGAFPSPDSEDEYYEAPEDYGPDDMYRHEYDPDEEFDAESLPDRDDGMEEYWAEFDT